VLCGSSGAGVQAGGRRWQAGGEGGVPTGRLNIRLNTTSLVLLNRRFTACTQLEQCQKETRATVLLVTNGCRRDASSSNDAGCTPTPGTHRAMTSTAAICTSSKAVLSRDGPFVWQEELLFKRGRQPVFVLERFEVPASVPPGQAAPRQADTTGWSCCKCAPGLAKRTSDGFDIREAGRMPKGSSECRAATMTHEKSWSNVSRSS